MYWSTLFYVVFSTMTLSTFQNFETSASLTLERSRRCGGNGNVCSSDSECCG
eukprot:Pgem_evm1s13720